MTTLHVFTTGGTIDKMYFDALSDFKVGEPQISRLLTEANVTFEWRVTPLMRKDSLELTEADRQEIRQHVLASDSQQVLVTHGTDTMVATALALQGIPDKTIVLTGSMVPALQRYSDAVFNIGFAAGVVRTQPAGVFIAINGQVLLPEHASKNRAANRFEVS